MWEVSKSRSGSQIGLVDPTWDWWDLASCFYLGHREQNVFRQFTVNCLWDRHSLFPSMTLCTNRYYDPSSVITAKS